MYFSSRVILLISLKLFSFCHHHFTKFIKVHGSRTVFVKFLKNALNLFLSKRSKKLSDDFSQSVISDEALALPVVQLESILQFLLHLLQRRILHKEGCTKLAKFSELNFSRSIFINLMEKISKFFFSGSESHGSHDLTKIISGKNSTCFVSNKSKQTFKHLISSVARLVKSLISSKSISAYGSLPMMIEVEYCFC